MLSTPVKLLKTISRRLRPFSAEATAAELENKSKWDQFKDKYVSGPMQALEQHNIESELLNKDFLPSFVSPYMHSSNNEDYTAELILTDYIQQQKQKAAQSASAQAQQSADERIHIYTICGGGDTTPSLLAAKNNITIDCVDQNEYQIYLCDLKIKAMLNLDNRDESLFFLLSKYVNGNNNQNSGDQNSDEQEIQTAATETSDVNTVESELSSTQTQTQTREDIYNNKIRDDLYSDDCRLFWDNRLYQDISYGVIGSSQYDRILSFISNHLSPECNCTQAAQFVLDKYLKDEYLDIIFDYSSRPRVFADVKRIASHHRKLLENFQTKQSVAIQDNYYYTLIRNLDFANAAADESGFPLWLQSQYFDAFKGSKNAKELDSILEFHIGDAFELAVELAQQKKRKYDLISLSNALEWMSAAVYARVIANMSTAMNAGGIILHRFHLTEDEEMIKQIQIWNQVISDTNEFDILDVNDELHQQVFQNERSKFGFEPQCISIAIKK